MKLSREEIKAFKAVFTGWMSTHQDKLRALCDQALAAHDMAEALADYKEICEMAIDADEPSEWDERCLHVEDLLKKWSEL